VNFEIFSPGGNGSAGFGAGSGAYAKGTLTSSSSSSSPSQALVSLSSDGTTITLASGPLSVVQVTSGGNGTTSPGQNGVANIVDVITGTTGVQGTFTAGNPGNGTIGGARVVPAPINYGAGGNAGANGQPGHIFITIGS